MTGTELPTNQKERVRLIAEVGRQDFAEVGNNPSILAVHGPSAPHDRALMDKLEQVQGRREDLEKRVRKLDCAVVELESRQSDAKIIRRNLESFSGFYTKLTPPQQRNCWRYSSPRSSTTRKRPQ